MSPEEKAQVIESAMEEIMSQPKRGAWLVLRDIAAAYRAEGEAMTVDTDPSADDHRDLIGFLRENATELGITDGWSTQDRAAAREEAERLTPPTAAEEAGNDVYEKFVERVNEIQGWCPACGGSGMVMEFGPTDCPNLESHRMLAYLTEQFPANWIIQSAQQRVEKEWGSPRW